MKYVEKFNVVNCPKCKIKVVTRKTRYTVKSMETILKSLVKWPIELFKILYENSNLLLKP